MDCDGRRRAAGMRPGCTGSWRVFGGLCGSVGGDLWLQMSLIVSIILRGSNDVMANCTWLSRASIGQTWVAPAFTCLARPSMDGLGVRWFGCLSRCSERVNRAECVLGRLCRILINVLGFGGFWRVLGGSSKTYCVLRFWVRMLGWIFGNVACV